MRPLLPPLCLGLCLALGACRSVGPRGVVLASSPPGARVLVDGVDSGFVTPCALDLSDGPSRKQIDFELPGYATETRQLGEGSSYSYVSWLDGDLGLVTWRFPLWLSAGPLFLPVERRAGTMPSRVHVRLTPLGPGTPEPELEPFSDPPQ